MSKLTKNAWKMSKLMLIFNQAKRQAHNKDTKASRIAKHIYKVGDSS